MPVVVRSLSAWYGQNRVLFDVDLEVGDSEIVGVFGHNGAGKSTLLRVLAGVHHHATLQASLGDRELAGLGPDSVARHGLVLVREGAQVFQGLTVEEHLTLGSRLGRMSGRGGVAADEIYASIPMLGQFRRRLGSELSGGQRQLLALGAAFSANPACLLLDEPSTGLAPQALDAVFNTLRAFSDRGIPLLVTEQNPTWLASLADRAYLLELGRIIANGTPSSVLKARESDASPEEARHVN